MQHTEQKIHKKAYDTTHSLQARHNTKREIMYIWPKK